MHWLAHGRVENFSRLFDGHWRGEVDEAGLLPTLRPIACFADWLFVDPLARLSGAALPNALVFWPSDPEHIAGATVLAAAHRLRGSLLLDVDRLQGLWGAKGVLRQLWYPLLDLPAGFEVVVLEVR